MKEKRFEEKELFSLKWTCCGRHGWHCQVVPYHKASAKPQPAPLAEHDWLRYGGACYYTNGKNYKARIVGPSLSTRDSKRWVWVLVDYAKREAFSGPFKHEWMLRLVEAESLSPLGAGIEPPPAMPVAWKGKSNALALAKS